MMSSLLSWRGGAKKMRGGVKKMRGGAKKMRGGVKKMRGGAKKMRGGVNKTRVGKRKTRLAGTLKRLLQVRCQIHHNNCFRLTNNVKASSTTLSKTVGKNHIKATWY
jgi:hypothetical protein